MPGVFLPRNRPVFFSCASGAILCAPAAAFLFSPQTRQHLCNILIQADGPRADSFRAHSLARIQARIRRLRILRHRPPCKTDAMDVPGVFLPRNRPVFFSCASGAILCALAAARFFTAGAPAPPQYPDSGRRTACGFFPGTRPRPHSDTHKTPRDSPPPPARTGT